jgi:hypothetical protein
MSNPDIGLLWYRSGHPGIPGLDRVLRSAQDPDAPVTVLDQRKDVHLRAIVDRRHREDASRIGRRLRRRHPRAPAPGRRLRPGHHHIKRPMASHSYSPSRSVERHQPRRHVLGAGSPGRLLSRSPRRPSRCTGSWPQPTPTATAPTSPRRSPASAISSSRWAGMPRQRLRAPKPKKFEELLPV